MSELGFHRIKIYFYASPPQLFYECDDLMVFSRNMVEYHHRTHDLPDPINTHAPYLESVEALKQYKPLITDVSAGTLKDFSDRRFIGLVCYIPIEYFIMDKLSSSKPEWFINLIDYDMRLQREFSK